MSAQKRGCQSEKKQYKTVLKLLCKKGVIMSSIINSVFH